MIVKERETVLRLDGVKITQVMTCGNNLIYKFDINCYMLVIIIENYFHQAAPNTLVAGDLAWCLRQRRTYAALARVQSRGFMHRQRLQSRGRVSVEQGWRATGKKNPARQPGIISKWGGYCYEAYPCP